MPRCQTHGDTSRRVAAGPPNSDLLVLEEWDVEVIVAAEEHGAGEGGATEAVSHRVDSGVERARNAAVEAERELQRTIVSEVRNRDADERERAFRNQRLRLTDQPTGRSEDGRRLCGRLGEGDGARRPREVAEAQPQHDGSSDPLGRAQSARHPVDEADEPAVDLLCGPLAPTDCALGADRAPSGAALDRPRVTVVGKRVEVMPGAAPEHRDQRVDVDGRDVADAAQAARVQLAGCRRPHAPEPFNGQRMQELELTTDRYDEQAVGLRDGARDLRKELRAGDSDSDRQPDLVAHVPSELGRDLDRAARDPLEPAHVEEGLVDRERLHERGCIVEDAEDGPARLDVRVESWPHDYRIGAERPRLAPTHRGLHTARLRLVARGEDDPAADDHGPAAEPGVVTLLDRRVERIEVGVQDAGQTDTLSNIRSINVVPPADSSAHPVARDGGASVARERVTIAPALPEDGDYLLDRGVTEFVDRGADLATEVRKAHPDGIDAIVDLATFAPDATPLRAGGRLASPLGAAGEGAGRFNLMAQPSAENLERLARLIDDGGLRVPIQQSYPLDQVAEAIRVHQTSHTQGKLGLSLT